MENEGSGSGQGASPTISVNGVTYAPQPESLSFEAARAKIDTLKGDREFRTRLLNGDTSAKEQWETLNKQAVDPATIVDETPGPRESEAFANIFNDPKTKAAIEERNYANSLINAAEMPGDLGEAYSKVIESQNSILAKMSADQVDAWAKEQRRIIDGRYGPAAEAKLAKVGRFIEGLNQKVPGSKEYLLGMNGAWSAMAVSQLITHIEWLESQGRKF